MSGFEIAGIVLGVIPIVISALEHYKDGIQTSRRFISYKAELRKLKIILVTEEATFRNTCETLLNSIANPTAMEDLLQNPGGSLWTDPALNRRLKSRLGSSHSIYITHLEDMNAALQAFQQRLGMDPNGKVSWTEGPLIKRALKAGKLSISKSSYDDLINEIRDCNRALRQLTSQGIQLEPSRYQRRQMTTLDLVRKYTHGIFEALSSSLQCACQLSHHTGIFLKAASLDEEDEITKFQFQVLFTSQSITGASSNILHQLTIQPLESTLSPQNFSTPDSPSTPINQQQSTRKKSTLLKNAQNSAILSVSSMNTSAAPCADEIRDLCKVIKTYSRITASDNLGILIGPQARFHVQTLMNVSVPATKSPWASLHQILNEGPRSAHRLSRSDKLNLAAVLSSSVLALHGTPWINSQWTKQDILFFNPTPNLSITSTFVSKGIASANPDIASSGVPILADPSIRNLTVFTLGILLIEICLGQPLEHFRSADDPVAPDGSATLQTDFFTAHRLIQSDQVLLEGGPRYEGAVRCCIYCQFDHRIRKPDLEHDDFRQALYDVVVVPLAEETRDFHKTMS